MVEIAACTAATNNIRILDDQPALTSAELKEAFDKTGEDIVTYLNGTMIPDIQTGVNKEITEMQTYVDTKVSDVEDEMDNLKTEIEDEMSSLEEDLDAKITGVTDILDGAFKIINYTRQFNYAGDHVHTEWTLNAPTGYVFGGVVNKYRADPSDMAKDGVITCNKQPGATSSISISIKYTGNDAGTCILGFSVVWIKSSIVSFK